MSTEQAVSPSAVDNKVVATSENTDLKSQEVPVVITKRFNALKNVQLAITEIEAKFYDELHELECKYAKLYAPQYEKRRQIVVGEHEPTDDEGKWALDDIPKKETSAGKDMLQMMKDQLSCAKSQGRSADDKGIVNFWLETMQSFRITSQLIDEHDEPILSFLQDIQVTLFDKKPFGYTLEFFFAENPYFTNKILTKTYELNTEVDPKNPFAFEGPDLKKSIGCQIGWKVGKNVTVKTVKKKVKSKKNKKLPPKVVTKEIKQDSFFNFFDTSAFEKLDEKKTTVAVVGGEQDEEENSENEEAEMMMYADFEIGQYMREKIVPKAILYFTGEFDDSEDYEEYEEDEDEDDEQDDRDDDDEDDEDDDDEESDEDDAAIKKSKGSKKGGKKAEGKSGEPTPTECKNQ